MIHTLCTLSDKFAGAMRKKNTKSVTISIRTNADLKRRLEAIAVNLDRSLSWVSEKALTAYADSEEDAQRQVKTR